MKIGVPAETRANETCISATLETVRKYMSQGRSVSVQRGAGTRQATSNSIAIQRFDEDVDLPHASASMKFRLRIQLAACRCSICNKVIVGRHVGELLSTRQELVSPPAKGHARQQASCQHRNCHPDRIPQRPEGSAHLRTPQNIHERANCARQQPNGHACQP